jgi:hypothetical protein
MKRMMCGGLKAALPLVLDHEERDGDFAHSQPDNRLLMILKAPRCAFSK